MNAALASIEFVVEGPQADLVVDTARACAGDHIDRITVAPIDGSPRLRVVIAARREALSGVMKAVMNALDKSG